MLIGYSPEVTVNSRYIETNSGKTRGTSNSRLSASRFCSANGEYIFPLVRI